MPDAWMCPTGRRARHADVPDARRVAGTVGMLTRSAPGYRGAVSDSVDLCITGGTIVDGTGSPGQAGTVLVEGDRLRVVAADAPLPEHAARTIDATGRVVAPGFIDLHSHGGLTIL